MIYRFLQKAINYTSAVIFGAASVLAIICVFFRYVLNYSIFWGEEAIRIMFIWMFMISAAEAFRREKHITLDFFLEMWPNPIKRICKIIIDIIIICFLGVFTYLGIESCLSNTGQTTAAMGLPFSIAYIAIPLGSVLMIVFIIQNLIARIKNKEPAGG